MSDGVVLELFDRDFCIELDHTGDVVSVELGTISDVPTGLVALAGAATSLQSVHAQFLWVEARSPAIRVALDSCRTRRVGRTVTLTGHMTHDLPHGLTRRELDVLTQLSTGSTNQEISGALGMSLRTVTTHVDRILHKLGAASRTSAAVLARQQGLVKLPTADDDPAFSRIQRLLGLEPSGTPSAQSRLIPRRKPLVIGAAFPASGEGAADGLEMARASRLAVDELNDRGGVDGRAIELDVVDVDIMSSTSIADALAALTSRGADVLVSGYLAHQDVAHAAAARTGLPYLHATTTHAMEERVRREPDRFGNVFQVCPSDTNYAPRFISFLTGLRDSGKWSPSSHRLLIVEKAWSLSDFGSSAARGMAERCGWQLDVVRPDPPAGEPWAAVATYLRRTEPAAVMIGHFMVDGAVSFMEQFIQDAPDTLVYLLFAPGATEFRLALGSRADGIVWATVAGTYGDAISRPCSDNYRSRFARSPGRVSAGTAYDRVRLLGLVWSQTDNPKDPAAVLKGLREVVYRGVNGVYFFGSGGQTAKTYPGAQSDPSLAQAHLVFQVQEGHNRVIAPAPYAESNFTAPTWLRRTRGSR